MIKIISIFCISASLLGCATANKLNAINIGMTKDIVVQTLGEPTSTSAIKNIQYLKYDLSPNINFSLHGITKQYYVRLVNGKVDAFGETGDFDSTKIPETKSTINLNVKS